MTDSDARRAETDGRRDGHKGGYPEDRERDRAYPGPKQPRADAPGAPPVPMPFYPPLGEMYPLEGMYPPGGMHPMGQPYPMGRPMYPEGMYPMGEMHPMGPMFPMGQMLYTEEMFPMGAPGYGPLYMWPLQQGQFPPPGGPAGPQGPAQAVPGLDEVLAALHRAHVSLSLQCAVASLGQYIPEMRRLPGYEELHRENYEVAYHLTTAIGSARRILAGARDPGYFAKLISCQRAAYEHQERAAAAFQRLAAAAPAQLRPTVQRLGGYIQATTREIRRAIALTTAALGPRTINQLQEWAEGTGREQ